MKTKYYVMAFGFLLISAEASSAESSGVTHSHHAQLNVVEQTIVPTEGGQSGFAAIAEIVQILRDDSQTVWEKVDIASLREHLVDMNELALKARVTTSVDETGVTFHVSGDGPVLRAIHAMVPAHSAVLNNSHIFDVEAEILQDGAVMRIGYGGQDERVEIMALGFFGIMAIGAHHQEHHMLMAKGSGH